jgi:NIPSNAP protein
MNRRDFVAGSVGASLVPALGQAPASAQTPVAPATAAKPQLLELRRIHLRQGQMVTRYHEYAKTALVPALNRAGVKPVGAFTVSVGPDSPTVYLLLPHSSGDSTLTLTSRLNDDAEYQKVGATFRALPASDPPYLRRESSLMTTFAGSPTLDPPTGPNAVPSRVFELRTYKSHNDRAGAKKIEMFEKGEFPIFRRAGLNWVFFAKDVVSSGLPSLTYLLVFANLAAYDKAWATFRDDPDWVKLRGLPEYQDIVSTIDNVLLRPTDYSQI